MSNTLTIRLPEELLDRLREKSRHTGLPMGQVVRQSLEAAPGRMEIRLGENMPG
jgi:predicted DNA-binding protein